MAKVRWDRIEKLRDILKSRRDTKHRKFNMGTWIEFLSLDEDKFSKEDGVPIKALRKDGPECGAAACLAGEVVIQFANQKFKFVGGLWKGVVVTQEEEVGVNELARRLLGLGSYEAFYMFQGIWCSDKRTNISSITKRDGVRYLTKALKERDIMVEI